MTRAALLDLALSSQGRFKTSAPEFTAWVRVETLLTEEAPIPHVARRFVREIGDVLGAEIAGHLSSLIADKLRPAASDATAA